MFHVNGNPTLMNLGLKLHKEILIYESNLFVTQMATDYPLPE